SEIDKMVKDAEAHAAEDKRKRELAEARNHADSLVHTTEKSLTEFGDKVGAAEKQAIEADLAALKSALESEDAANIKAKTEALTKSSMKLGEAMYKAQQADAAAGAQATGGASDAHGQAGQDG